MSEEVPNSQDGPWDPMKKDFYDPSFNSYSQGPGSRLDRAKQPCFPKTSRESPIFKLYIRNIPSELTEVGIKNIFLHFGDPIEVFRHPPGSGEGWAIVTYATLNEASLAIRKLNNTPPFNLKVQFARSPEEKERLRQERMKSQLLNTVLEGESYVVPDVRSGVSRGIGRGRAVAFPRRAHLEPRPGKLSELEVVDFEDLGYFVPYIPGTFHETNKMVMQGLNLNVNTPHGSRRVVMGRAYCPLNKRNDTTVKTKPGYDRVTNGLHEFGTRPDISRLCGECLHCSTKTTHICQRCRGWYCTRECQQADWPNHKAHCTPGGFECKQRKTTENNCIETNPEQFEDIENDAGGIIEQLRMFTFVKVTIPIGPWECWAQLVDSELELVDIMCALNKETEFPALEKVEVGALCLAMFGDMWFRGRITSTEPEVKVLYIDYGNEEKCPVDQLRALPETLLSVSAMAFKIKLAAGTSQKHETLHEDQVLKIRSVGTSDDVIMVQVEGESYNNIAASEDTSERETVTNNMVQSESGVTNNATSVVASLKPGMEGGCQFRKKLGNGDFSIVVVDQTVKSKFDKLVKTLCKFSEDSEAESYNASVGETVAVMAPLGGPGEGNGCFRARVLAVKKDGYLVNLCDEGRVALVRTVRKLPEDLVDFPEFAARCGIVEELTGEDAAGLGLFLYTVMSVDEAVTCELRSLGGRDRLRVVLRPWSPPPGNMLQTVRLSNNDKVVLSVFFDQHSLFLRSVEESCKDLFSRVQQDVALHCLEAPGMEDPPQRNQVLACKFLMDGNYYRAQVLDVDKELVHVAYIDFGNVENVHMERLKPLPEDLRELPALAVKVGLRSVIHKPMTKSAAGLLTRLVGEEVEMEVLVAESLSEGVELVLPDGKSLNVELNTCLNPVADPKLKECVIFTEQDLSYVELPLRQDFQFFVLHKLDSITFMGCETRNEVVSYVHGTMATLLDKYCAATTEESYVPRISELCLAKFEDGCWYRAMCVGEDASRESNILFLDFGNMAYVDKTNIRKMPEEFMEAPAVALFCSLQDLDHDTASEEQKQLVEALVRVNKTHMARVVERQAPGVYIIELPHVTDVLKKQDLL